MRSPAAAALSAVTCAPSPSQLPRRPFDTSVSRTALELASSVCYASFSSLWSSSSSSSLSVWSLTLSTRSTRLRDVFSPLSWSLVVRLVASQTTDKWSKWRHHLMSTRMRRTKRSLPSPVQSVGRKLLIPHMPSSRSKRPTSSSKRSLCPPARDAIILQQLYPSRTDAAGVLHSKASQMPVHIFDRRDRVTYHPP